MTAAFFAMIEVEATVARRRQLLMASQIFGECEAEAAFFTAEWFSCELDAVPLDVFDKVVFVWSESLAADVARLSRLMVNASWVRSGRMISKKLSGE